MIPLCLATEHRQETRTMKAHAADRTRIAGLLATLALVLAAGAADVTYAAVRNVVGELWSADG